jgi:hypothetical protein
MDDHIRAMALVNDSSSVWCFSSTDEGSSSAGYIEGSEISNTSRHIALTDKTDQSMADLRFYTYGIVMPVMCGLGIFGNILNLAVLTRPNMRGVSHVYMRGDIYTQHIYSLDYWFVKLSLFSTSVNLDNFC